MNRLLLAMAFLPTGLVKLTGQRFTTLPVDNPIGFFFEAMYRTGPYWHFIGLVQVVAAVLLLVPATATLGALVFLPVGVSVFLITLGVGFGNTTIVTGGMLLACIYLVCWDADRVWDGANSLLGPRKDADLLAGMTAIERSGWIGGAAVGMMLFLSTRGLVPARWRLGLLLAGLAAFGLVLLGWITGAIRAHRASLASVRAPLP